ncbi:MAG: DUF2264 domain-containing protein [Bacteroidaceae bacterium]|nr:DUF2264 domain-containing protein [Bacteroidaceae bacterium]
MNKYFLLLIGFILLPSLTGRGEGVGLSKKTPSDREVWVDIMYQMAEPVLRNMAEGKLQQNMTLENGGLEISPTWDGRDKKVSYMECFARLMAGLAPWLSLPDDDTAEGAKRRQLREWALKAYANAVNPASPDYLGWTSGGQTLVDAAYLVESLYRGYDALWKPLDDLTKQRYIKEIQGLRRYDPPYTNWLLFVAMEESFLMYVGADYDAYRIKMALAKVEEWYIGDGLYSDGPSFAFDYYNAYVIHPMYVEALEMIAAKQPNNSYLIFSKTDGQRRGAKNRLEEVRKRMQKYSIILERFISPEGTYPVVGRSIPYRMAVFQPLAQLAWRKQLPKELTNGQVRAGITAVARNMFCRPGVTNFNKQGFLTIGFIGNHPNVADWYTNNGSLYMTSLAFLPLGLPADDAFWTDPAEKWTSKKAWDGDDFPKDHKWDINSQRLYWE